MRGSVLRSLCLLAGGAVLASMLSLFRGAEAAPQGGQPPFRNSVEQREEMIRELREIKQLLKEQNTLLRANPPVGHAPGKP